MRHYEIYESLRQPPIGLATKVRYGRGQAADKADLEGPLKRFRTREVPSPAADRCSYYASAVVGSMIARISEIRLAGKPPRVACSRTISSLGAI